MKVKFLITFLLLAFIIILFFLGLKNNNIYETKNLIGKKIHNFEILNFDEDTLIKNNSLKNNEYTLINFWSSWCTPCRNEHVYLSLLNKNNLKILGINFKDKKNNAKDFLSELGNPYYEILNDKNGKESVNFGVFGIPESILVDKNLIIVKKYIGPLNKSTYEEIIKIVKNK